MHDGHTADYPGAVTPADLSDVIVAALAAAVSAGDLALSADQIPESVVVERPKGQGHGDFATNIAMRLAKAAGVGPREFADVLARQLRAADGVAEVEVAGPGFVNITLESAAQGELARTVVAAGHNFGHSRTLQGQSITVKGGKGTLNLNIHSSVEVVREESVLTFVARNGDKGARAQAGCTRALVNNMVVGVSQGFEKKLQLVGVGYRAKATGSSLSLTLGFSHPVEFEVPAGVSVETPTQTEVLLKSADKQLLGQVAAEIRSFRPPEPYKGKGVRFADEIVLRKEAKKK